MSARKWHKGPPPHVGWWAASNSRNQAAWRWWNGKRWGLLTFQSAHATHAAFNAEHPTAKQDGIEWRHYYPANARVPRIDPRSNP